MVISAWRPVVRNTRIPFDLESTPLQIKTDSTVGSGERIMLWLYTADAYIGGWDVLFSSSIKFFVLGCSEGWAELPVQLRARVVRVTA